MFCKRGTSAAVNKTPFEFSENFEFSETQEIVENSENSENYESRSFLENSKQF